MRQMKVIDLQSIRRKKEKEAERAYCDRIAEAWAIYADFQQVAPYLPKAVLLRIMGLCREVLLAREEN